MKTVYSPHLISLRDAIDKNSLPKDYTGAIECCLSGARYTYLNGLPHSFDDKPALHHNDYDAWFMNGKLHRVGRPAAIYHTNNEVSYRLECKPILYVEWRMKQYWIDCWEKYRTPENENLIIAGLLSSAK